MALFGYANNPTGRAGWDRKSGGFGAANHMPGHIRPEVFSADGAMGGSLDADANPLAKLLLHANSFAKKADRCARFIGKIGLLIRIQAIDVGAECFHE